MQILSGVLLEATGDGVRVAATDMELSIRSQLDARVEREGQVVVPGRLLVDVSRLLPGGDVEIEYRESEGVVHLVSGATHYQLHTYAAEDFPRLPDVASVALHSIETKAFLETISRVSRAVSRDESRPVLTGVLVRFEASSLVMAATDSYRLSVKQTPLESEVPELEAIVPGRALEELRRLASDESKIELGVHENQVIFGVEGTWLTTRRIDGQFPNYKQLLPETFEHEVRLPREELLEVVRRVAVLAQRNSPLRLRFAPGELTISAQTQEVGEARETLPARFEGDPLEIGFNADFLRDGIESADGDEISLGLINPLRPGLIRGVGEDFWYLIMPIRLAG